MERMRYEIVGAVSHPWERVLRVYRDDVEALVPYLENIERIELIRHEEVGPGQTKIRRKWVGRYKVPLLARPFISPDMIYWYDEALWDEAEKGCRYTFEFPVLNKAVSVAGRNTFAPDGEGRTRMTITGELSIRVPGLGEGIARQVESFVIGLVKPNLEKINVGLQRYLDEEEAAPRG